MRALVISGGGSKGAFAGGVAQYLLQNKRIHYDLFIGTSTGSLLIPHLALGNINKLHNIYTNVNMEQIFDINPFIIKRKGRAEYVTINHFNVIWQFIRGRRTFGESRKLREFIKTNFSESEFEYLKSLPTDVIVTVTNISKNQPEYKSIKDCTYEEFCDWIWISSNYIPFMSLVKKNFCEYGDGGFSCFVPIAEAINRGATEIDVIILETEIRIKKTILGKNPFSLLINLFLFTMDQVGKRDLWNGKLAAKNKNTKLNLYYTPTKLTNNALIFNQKKMKKWWDLGFKYAQNKSEIMSDNK
ncbi:patatin-like phospholipase family protein [Flavobacterium aquiphilum]|uniref:patatin-like phospholipase family protein n=1 Tax=Flavobacterium aquiphilum TaxID=3003261 RepID=UPI002480A9C7|nr:patatin-like phospholipase family protein [Flavobacterium aquiphilum]